MQQHHTCRPSFLKAVPFLAPLVVASLSWPSLAGAQAVHIDDKINQITIQFDEIEGTPLEEFIKLAQQLLDVQLTFEPADTKDIKLRFIGPRSMPRDQFWPYFQAVIKSKDFVPVPYGSPKVPGRPVDGDGVGYFAIRRTTGGVGGATKPGYIRSLAPFVTSQQLQAFINDDGLVLTTSFQLENVNAQEMVNMLQTYYSDPMIESVRAVSGSNSLVATGYASRLVGVAAMLKEIDVPMPTLSRTMKRFPLAHAVADEIRPTIEAFLASEQLTVQNPQLPTNMVPNPVVRSDIRTNSLLVLGTTDQHTKVDAYVAEIDVPVAGPTTVSIIVLKYAVAQEVADLIHNLGRNNTVRAVPDFRTNTLVLSAPQERAEELKAIITSLDVSTER